MLKNKAAIKIEIVDVLGNNLATLENEYKQAGRHTTSFYPDQYAFTNGLYFYKITVNGFPSVLGRMVLVR